MKNCQLVYKAINLLLAIVLLLQIWTHVMYKNPMYIYIASYCSVSWYYIMWLGGVTWVVAMSAPWILLSTTRNITITIILTNYINNHTSDGFTSCIYKSYLLSYGYSH